MSLKSEVGKLPASIVRLAGGETETVTEADARAVLTVVRRLQTERDAAHRLLIEHAVATTGDGVL